MLSTIQYIVWRVRRNHGLEHATLHILSSRFPRRSLAGYSDPQGFWLVGDVPTEEVARAVHDAQARMLAGETSLAIHPNCGTNIVVSGMLAGLASFAGMAHVGKSFRDKIERLPLVATLATLALIIAQPVGYRLQERYTTSGLLEGLRVVSIRPSFRSGVTAHRIVTEG